MYLNRTRDPALAAEACEKQRKLVELISEMKQKEEPPERLTEIAELLSEGVNPSIYDYNLSLYYAAKNYFTPLHYAARKDLRKTMELLLKYEADPNAVDRYEVTPLHLAAESGSAECLRMLIDANGNVNVKTRSCQEKERKGNGDCSCDALTRTGPCYQMPYRGGTTPLHLAAKADHIDCVRLLMDTGADYNAVDDDGQTSLYLTARLGLPKCMMVLLHSAVGFPILSIPDKHGNTPLHECFYHGPEMTECVKALVHLGSDVSLTNSQNESSVDIALRHHWDPAIIEFMVLEGYGMDFDKYVKVPRPHVEPAHNILPTALLLVTYGNHVRRTAKLWNLTENIRVTQNLDLAVFFIRIGAARANLKTLLLAELKSDEPGGMLLQTLMDSFAYLPRFSFDEINSAEGYPDNDDNDSQDPTQQMLGVVGIGMSNTSLVLLGDHLHRHQQVPIVGLTQPRPTQSRPRPITETTSEKIKEYHERSSQVPTLAHLSRSCIRSAMQANVRTILKFPIPTNMKEYILLGYKVPEGNSWQQ